MSLERWLYTVPLRIRSLFRRSRVEGELDEELRFHLDRQTEALIAQGMAPTQARSTALRALGGVERQKEECRDARRVAAFENLARDARHAIRGLARTPGFTAVSVLTLALGIGANTAIFTVVNSVLLRPLAYRDPDRLVVIELANSHTVTGANLFDWKAGTSSFEQMGAAEGWGPNLTGADRPETLSAVHLTGDLLRTLGVEPAMGRLFLPEEDHAGRSRVALLRHDFWVARFARNPSIIGRSITLDGEPHTIVGIMPPGFRFAPYWATDAVLAAPLVLDHRREDRGGSSLRLFARLAPGVTLARAQAELTTVAARLEQQHPGTNQGVIAIPMQDVVVGSVKTALIVLLSAVGLVLLVACANTAHLQLMRAAAREREFAVRATLGGSRKRLMQQSLVESAVLALVGGAAGLALAKIGILALVAIGPAGIPRLDELSIDRRVLAFAGLVTLGASVLFGLTPALAAARTGLMRSIREGGRGSGDGRRGRTRHLLVGSEFAMAVVLLIGAGLVLRSFIGLLRLEPGYDPRNVLSMQIAVKGTSREGRAERLQFFSDVVDRVRTVPGVVSASLVNHLPLHGDHWRFPFAIEGRPPALPGRESKAMFRVVQNGYFRTMRIPVIQGRDFRPDDQTGPGHVVIINEAMARAHWPGQSPIGQRMTIDPLEKPDWFTVVGVVRDVRHDQWSSGEGEEMYFPERESLAESGILDKFLNPESMTLVIRARASAADLPPAIGALVGEIEPNAPLADVITMEQAIDEQFAEPRFYLLLFGAFAVVALILAAVGVFGVINYSVARRAQEMGVRIALGSTRGQAFLLVVKQGVAPAVAGGAVGLVAALMVTRFLRTLLYRVEPTDPLTFAAVVGVLGTAAIVAAAFPARRASLIDPMVALRQD